MESLCQVSPAEGHYWALPVLSPPPPPPGLPGLITSHHRQTGVSVLPMPTAARCRPASAAVPHGAQDRHGGGGWRSVRKYNIHTNSTEPE